MVEKTEFKGKPIIVLKKDEEDKFPPLQKCVTFRARDTSHLYRRDERGSTEVRMQILQLDPPIPLDTPRGPGIAHLVIDYGIEQNLMWTVFLDASGECWTFSNPEIRAQKNITLGRNLDNPDPSHPEEPTKTKPLDILGSVKERPAPTAMNVAFPSKQG